MANEPQMHLETDVEYSQRVQPAKAMTSILQREYNRGYRDGLGQISQMEWGEAFEKGRLEAYVEAPSRFRWFTLGVIAAVVIGWLI